MRSFTLPLIAAVLLLSALGCNWSFGTNPNTSSNNSNNTNRSESNTNTSDDHTSSSPTPDASRDMTPEDIDVGDMVTSVGDTTKVGRMVTVTGGVLENIDSDKLRIRAPYGGAAFYCKGDFSDYMEMAGRVSSLAQSGRSPKATVKGMYKMATIGTGAELDPCVLSNIEKP